RALQPCQLLRRLRAADRIACLFVERFMSRRLMTIAGILLLFVCGASAQAPSPEAMNAARKLVVTLKIGDQYRALLPLLLLKLRPVVAQDSPEIERDYDAMTAP